MAKHSAKGPLNKVIKYLPKTNTLISTDFFDNLFSFLHKHASFDINTQVKPSSIRRLHINFAVMKNKKQGKKTTYEITNGNFYYWPILKFDSKIMECTAKNHIKVKQYFNLLYNIKKD